jgi:homogentisate 1,2-dioxygenase
VGTIAFDHPDRSIFTVLTYPTSRIVCTFWCGPPRRPRRMKRGTFSQGTGVCFAALIRL